MNSSGSASGGLLDRVAGTLVGAGDAGVFADPAVFVLGRVFRALGGTLPANLGAESTEAGMLRGAALQHGGRRPADVGAVQTQAPAARQSSGIAVGIIGCARHARLGGAPADFDAELHVFFFGGYCHRFIALLAGEWRFLFERD